MAESPIGSPMLKPRVPLVLDPPDEAWFDVGLMHKDIRLVRQAGAEDGSPCPRPRSRTRSSPRPSELGYAHRDIAAIHDLLAHLANNPAAVTS